MAELRVVVRGEIDITTAPQLRKDLQAGINENSAYVVIDCADMTFIDSTGVAVILEAHRDLQFQGRHLYVANIQHGPRRLFEMLGVTDLLLEERREHAR
jgi:anti-sigma B factor antagonist